MSGNLSSLGTSDLSLTADAKTVTLSHGDVNCHSKDSRFAEVSATTFQFGFSCFTFYFLFFFTKPPKEFDVFWWLTIRWRKCERDSLVRFSLTVIQENFGEKSVFFYLSTLQVASKIKIQKVRGKNQTVMNFWVEKKRVVERESVNHAIKEEQDWMKIEIVGELKAILFFGAEIRKYLLYFIFELISVFQHCPPFFFSFRFC